MVVFICTLSAAVLPLSMKKQALAVIFTNCGACCVVTCHRDWRRLLIYRILDEYENAIGLIHDLHGDLHFSITGYRHCFDLCVLLN